MITTMESGPTPSAARAMLRGGALPAAAVGVLVTAVAAVGGAGSAGSALLGAVLAMAALSAGPIIMILVRNRSPSAVMAAALLGYGLAVVVLGVAYLVLAPLSWVVGGYVGTAIIAVVMAWIGGQLLAVARLRILAYGSAADNVERPAAPGRSGSPESPFDALP